MATLSVPALRRRLRAREVFGPLADAAGKSAGRFLSVLPLLPALLPGIGGAAAISVCAGELAGHVFGHGLAPWVAGLVGGVFALLLDRRIP